LHDSTDAPASLLARTHHRPDGSSAPEVSDTSKGVGLWDENIHSFRGAALRRAILARGWTIPDFARATRLHTASVYNAVKGRPVRDSTAIRIFEALEKREPMSVAMQLAS
jgi:hypothetical protein